MDSDSAIGQKSRKIQHLLYSTVNERGAAAILGIGIQTARNWRFLKKGPPYIKMGRAVRYKIEDLEKYINSNRVDPEGSV